MAGKYSGRPHMPLARPRVADMHACPCFPQVYFLAFLSDPAEGDTRARVTLVLRYAAAEGLPVPLYDVAVDVDVHPHLAAPVKARLASCARSAARGTRWQGIQL